MEKPVNFDRNKSEIYFGADHAGCEMKSLLIAELRAAGFRCQDLGTEGTAAVNWVEFGARVAQVVSERSESRRGILVCGSGIGMSIVANRFPGVRAALCRDPHDAEMARRHNDANVLCLGARMIAPEKALETARVFLSSAFDGGRHRERLVLLAEIERNLCK